MDDEIKKYLFDIHLSINSIKEYVPEYIEYSEYSANKMMKRAVEREFEIIGEALNNILKILPTISIANSRRIVDFRNHLIHGYSTISDMVVWGIIKKDLIILESEISSLLENHS